MYYVRFPIAPPAAYPRALPTDDEHAPTGAVRCWVERETLVDAVSVARSSIEAHGWIVGAPVEARVVDFDAYAPGTDDRAYFVQAALDGECVVYELLPAEVTKGSSFGESDEGM